MIKAILFGFFLRLVQKQTLTKVEIVIEQIVQEKSDNLKNNAKATLVTRKD